jgi:hypothetical protein
MWPKILGFFFNKRLPPYLGYLFSQYRVFINFAKMFWAAFWAGFFHKILWPPWLLVCLSVFRQHLFPLRRARFENKVEPY